MADDEPSTPTQDGILNAVAEQTGDEGFQDTKQQKPKDFEPVYKMVGDSRIPTSKAHGKLWKSRRDAARKRLEKLGLTDNWDECIRYYKNDQGKTRKSGDVENYRRARSTRVGTPSYLETENIVFANTSALVPSLYAKNPTCDVTPNIHDPDNDDKQSDYQQLYDRSRVAKRLINALSDMKATPGINLKPKARKAVIMATLTNIAYIEIGYTMRDDSSNAALQNIIELTGQLKDAKDQQEIIQLEGDLQALEQKVDVLRPSGPYVKFRHPRDVLIDPDADEADGSDANWIMIADYVSTAFINAVYRTKSKGDDGEDEWQSVYQPTHVIGVADTGGVQEEINTFSLLGDNKDEDHKTFGFDDEDSYRDAQRTKVWYVWDKITRRVFMYNSNDWSWPIWVWDDPYNLDRFFPLYGLQFYTDPEDNIGPSEVMMYLDQQDAINSINGEVAKMRQRAINNIFYNKTVIRDPSIVEKYLGGETETAALGVDLPPETDISKVFFSALPPSAAYQELFKKDAVYASVDKVSSVSGVMQGQQFKTNTTNQAINTYNSQTQTRLDEKIDAVEDFIGDIMWGVMQMCLQYMPPEEVANVVGDEDAQLWVNMDYKDIRKSFSIRLTGGSLQKPTSQIKKAEAIQIGQVLGQYANAGGGAAIMIMLKALQRAFDDIVIDDEDWDLLEKSVVSNLQRGQSTGGAPQPGTPPQAGAPQPQPGQPTPQSGAMPPQAPPGAGMEQGASPELMQMFAKLPPQMQNSIEQALSQGVPIQEVIAQVMNLMGGGQGGQPQQ